MSETAPRPQKVTLACVAAGGGALIVLLSFVTILSDWVSPEVREQAELLLAEPPLKDSGVSTGQLLEALRIAMMVGSALSVAVIILAIHTAKRHRGARVVLTVLSVSAAVVFLPSGFTGVIPAAMAIASAVLLWSREANAWFNPEKAARAAAARGEPAGRPPEPFPDRSAAAAGEPAPPVQEPEPGPRPADVPFGSARPASAAASAPPQVASAQVRSAGLPGTVLAAVLITSVMSGIIILLSAVILVGYGSSPTALGEELLAYPTLADNPQMDTLGWSAAELGRIVVYTAAGLLLLSLAAVATALLLLRRSHAARIVMVVLSGVTIAVSAVATLAGVPWIAAAIAVIVLVFRPSANAYFAGDRPGPRS